MTFTIEGFSQEELVRLKLDNTDAVILRWFITFQLTGRMDEEKGPDGKTYFWVRYPKARDDLPILGLTPETLARRFRKMADSGVLKHYHHKVGGSFSMYRVGDCFEALAFTPPLRSNADPSASERTPPLRSNADQNTLLLNSDQKEKSQKNTKHKHGEYNHVLLTSSELEKLERNFPLDWEHRIKTMDEGIELKGYRYKSHYLAILKWAERDRATSIPLFPESKEEPYVDKFAERWFKNHPEDRPRAQ